MPYAKPLELAALPLEDKIEAAARRLLRECGVLLVGRRRMAEELVMPRLSDTMEQGTIAPLAASTRATQVSEGDVLAEIETDKATMELQAYDDGVLLQILVGDGETRGAGRADRDRRRAGRGGRRDGARRRRRRGRGRRAAQATGAGRSAEQRRGAARRPAAAAANGAPAAAPATLKASPIARRMADRGRHRPARRWPAAAAGPTAGS